MRADDGPEGRSPKNNFICHMGHGFSAAELDQAQMQQVDRTLETAARMINERALLCQVMQGVAHDHGDADFAFRLGQARREMELKAEAVRKIMEQGWTALGLRPAP
ncbi:hypothetical protein [Roseomonas elaeocarpi]|uniref:ANTAR domain-containing protein n=1 Tax=Roseomonas elaeocarpi TaxID=907779 RepID=A0ABV6JSB4_9PROT